MGTLNRTIIEKLFPPHIYERGLVYYNRNRVHGLSFNKQTDKWFAEVSGTQDYYVEVDLSAMKEGSIKAYCECPAFEMYNSCKHLAAVMLEVADRATDPKLSKRAISQFRSEERRVGKECRSRVSSYLYTKNKIVVESLAHCT